MHTVAPDSSDPSGGTRARSFGIVSTFPPTPCGIATFSAALSAGLIAGGSTVDVVRCGASPMVEDVLVAAALDGTAPSWPAAIAALNACDVVVVQHEYGLYAGADGASILGLVAALEVPVVVVAHTVLSDPTANQRSVLQGLCAAADAVVVMTETARQRLHSGFAVDRQGVVVIPHGAAVASAAPPPSTIVGAPARLLTWGLLGPGKGIEWAIDALAELDGMNPLPEYLVVGATHPKVRERQGELYRDMLVNRVAAGSSAVPVRFDDAYRDLASLSDLIQSVDLVVLPYDSTDQVTSGVLVDAVAAGRPVVATAFPHAVELLASGAGIVVPQRDPVTLGRAIRAVLTDAPLAASMAAEARRLAPSLSWASVARHYAALGDRLVASRSSVMS